MGKWKLGISFGNSDMSMGISEYFKCVEAVISKCITQFLR